MNTNNNYKDNGAAVMSSTDKQFTPADPMYPDVTVKLAGTDGNAFAVIGAVTGALRRKCGHNAANWFANEAMDKGSYDELLQFVMCTVYVS